MMENPKKIRTRSAGARNRRALRVLLCAALASAGAPAAERPSAPRSPGAVEVRDFRGRTVRLKTPARRVACLIESALSGLYMMGADDRVVGVPSAVYAGAAAPHYRALDPRIRNRTLPAPGNWDFINIESVLGLGPDLAVVWADQSESIASLEAQGIPVYAVKLHRFADVSREMRDLGLLTGRAAAADSLVRGVEADLAAFSAGLSRRAQRPPSVYFMWAQGPLETSGQNSTVNELLRLAGAVNAVPLPDEHAVVNLEFVLSWNPEVIVLWPNASLDPEDVRALPAWRGLSASVSGRVHELPDPFFCDFWTLKYAFAVKTVAKWCHPEALRGFDLEEEKRRMAVRLYGPRGKALVP
jgi:iron complex transport system substrate-binding protein